MKWEETDLPKAVGFTHSTNWLRTKISHKDSKTFYLVNPVSFVEEIYLYQIAIDKNTNDINDYLSIIDQNEVQSAGSAIPIQRKIYKKFPYPIFHISVSSENDSYVYLSFHSASSLYIEPLLFLEDNFDEVASELQLHLFIFLRFLLLLYFLLLSYTFCSNLPNCLYWNR
ncbi:MAG: hypothetical protein MH321_09990 [Leptospiraceae bacterium]|nr:hypothetical protein [Leptospiraceae bacterium]